MKSDFFHQMVRSVYQYPLANHGWGIRPTEVDVLGHCHSFDELEMLVNHSNSGFNRLGRRTNLMGESINHNLT